MKQNQVLVFVSGLSLAFVFIAKSQFCNCEWMEVVNSKKHVDLILLPPCCRCHILLQKLQSRLSCVGVFYFNSDKVTMSDNFYVRDREGAIAHKD